MKFSNELIAFAGNDTTFFEAFVDYYNNESARTVENSDKLHNAFFAEVIKRSGVSRDGVAPEIWAQHPNVQWAAMAVIEATTQAILPDVINRSVGMFTNLKYLDAGDILKIKVKPRTLYTVSAGAMGERTSYRQKKFNGNVVISPVEHIVTVYVDMYRVLAGKDDLAEAVRAVVASIEAEMSKDAVAALKAGLGAVSYPSTFKVQGSFDAAQLIALAERVGAYNYGMRPVILGTSAALAKVAPDSTLGYRMMVDGNGGNVRILNNFYGSDLIILPQFATSSDPTAPLALPDNTLFVVSPAADKLVYGAVSNAMTNSNQFYENADISQNYTMRKNWAFDFVGSAFAGQYVIQ